MNIGIVIVNYNDLENTVKLVKSIKDFKCFKSIVIVDNNSTDSSVKSLEKLNIKHLKIIKNEENYGYSKALNIGSKYLLETLDNPLICMSNTDIEIPDENVITTLASMINDEVKCVMPKVKEGTTFSYGWKLTTPFQDLMTNIPFINRLIRKKIINYNEDYFKEDNVLVDVMYGCFFMIEGSTLESINYFDENTFLYYEEYILARKLRCINKLSMLSTKVYVKHIHNAVIGNNLSKLNKYKIYKKSQLYYEKNYNKANIIEMALFKVFYYINLIPYKIKSLIKK